MFILEAEQSFDAAHFLSGYNGKCSNLHGHRWRVIAHIAKETLEKEGQIRDMVLDFGDFKDALKSIVDRFDHMLIVEEGSLKDSTLEVLGNEGFQWISVPFRPTAECFSKYFYEELKKEGLPALDVTVYETPTNGATYREDL